MRTRTIAFGLVLTLGAAVAAAQRQASPDPVTALLAEVHQLRLVMERSALLTPRIQLLTSRMALQDERVFRMARQAENVRDELERLAMQNRETATRVKQFDDLLTIEFDPRKRQELEDAQRFMKREAELQAAREQLLRTREAELATVLATEQAQWMDLNRRLDELERLLDQR